MLSPGPPWSHQIIERIARSPSVYISRVVITFTDARRGVVRLDVLASEIEEMAKKGTQQKRRGRKPKAAA